MPPSKRDSACGTERLGVLLLAAGYGTRLQREVAAAPHLSALAGTPKPLLPVAGRAILSHWLSALSAIPAQAGTIVVTNGAHAPLYERWAAEARAAGSDVTVLSDGSVDNASRLGAVKDIALGLAALRHTAADKALIIAGDTLLPGVDMHHYVASFANGSHDAATFAYPLPDMADCVRRGMFKVREVAPDVLVAEALVEKPRLPEGAPSRLASAPVYMLRKAVWHTVDEFLTERVKEGAPLEKRDAPGFWLGWLLPKVPCRLFCVEKRIDIGGLRHYMDALWELGIAQDSVQGTPLQRASTEPAVGRAHPRIGLLGNPSDGYGGKVISVSVASEGFAEVVATPHDKFFVHTNPDHELKAEFDDLDRFLEHVESHSLYFSARTLVLAAAVVFAKEYKKYLAEKNGVVENGDDAAGQNVLTSLPNCQLTYSTTIPARIGLSGSSAFILATLRALAKFHNKSLEEISSDVHTWPNLMRSAEADILGIQCGLQDRIVQFMQGCVAMDFTDRAAHKWDRLPEGSLPELWIAYHKGGRVGVSSGRVHGDLKSRYLARDPTVLGIMKQFCSLVDSGRSILEQSAKGDRVGLGKFASLVNKNFQLRLDLVGFDSVGPQSLKLISVGKEAGFAAKMTGSGGCALCVPDPVRSLSSEEIESATSIFEKHGMVLHKVEVLRARNWVSR